MARQIERVDQPDDVLHRQIIEQLYRILGLRMEKEQSEITQRTQNDIRRRAVGIFGQMRDRIEICAKSRLRENRRQDA
jgi:hypothetical protein